ncbi:MAG TPA: glycosyltransferase [Vicinamibacteria bacterium]|nr:glycosyltransferase [Vicinamibacteria bacterium]
MHGVKRLFAWMIPRFDRSRFHVSLLSLRKKDVSEDPLESYGFPVYYLEKGKFDPSTLPALVSLLSRLRIDVVQTHGYGATTFGRLAAVWRRIPNVLHEHANLTDTPWFQKIPDELLDPFTDVAIAVSDSTREFCIRARRLSSERVKRVYLGAPLEDFRPFSGDAALAARRRLGLPDRGEIFGTVTRLHESKGNRYFLDAASILAGKRPEARFVIVGEGPLQPDLEEQARTLGIADRVDFLGFQRDVAACFASFDVAVFPSLWEGTPLTLFEAMAMGKPVVATTVDGLTDVLASGETAILVPPRDPAALASAMIRVRDEPGLAERLSARAFSASRQFDIGAFVGKMERLYELLVGRYRSEGRRPRWDYGTDFEFLEETPIAERADRTPRAVTP